MKKVLYAFLLLSIAVLQANCSNKVAAIDITDQPADVQRAAILAEAEWALQQQPVTITAESSSKSAGGKHDFFSQADYFWPNPQNPGGPYINRDGETNPDNFLGHRKAMVR